MWWLKLHPNFSRHFVSILPLPPNPESSPPCLRRAAAISLCSTAASVTAARIASAWATSCRPKLHPWGLSERAVSKLTQGQPRSGNYSFNVFQSVVFRSDATLVSGRVNNLHSSSFGKLLAPLILSERSIQISGKANPHCSRSLQASTG